MIDKETTKYICCCFHFIHFFTVVLFCGEGGGLPSLVMQMSVTISGNNVNKFITL